VNLAGNGLGGAEAHLAYIQRDGVTREGNPGELYSAGTDVADGRAFLARGSFHRHQFRVIVSLEDGDQYPDLKPVVRRMMSAMETDLGTRLDWVAVDQVEVDPCAANAVPLVGRLIARGLADEHRDRHYMIVTVPTGGAIMSTSGAGKTSNRCATARSSRCRFEALACAPRTGLLSKSLLRTVGDAHLRHDPGAQQSFAETHVRRLEVMRRVMRDIEREPDGSWIVALDHLAKAEAFEKRQARVRRVDVEILSPVPLEQLSGIDGAS